MQQNNDTNFQDGKVAIVPGGIAYSAPILILGSVGLSITTSHDGTVNPASTFRIEYTDLGVSTEYLPGNGNNGPPKGNAPGWYPWTVGSQTYADGRYEDRVMAKWARLVFIDTGNASTGNINFAMTVRRYIGG